MSELARLDRVGTAADRAPLSSSNGAESHARVDTAHHDSWGLRDGPVGRVFDFVIALTALIFFAPLMAVVALLIRFWAPGPVFYVQQRIGKGGVPFPCFKFRSMVVNSSEVLERLLLESPEAREEWLRDQKLRNDPRITPIGRLLRKTSLDELPQLMNILVGHMSIVGPRPIVFNEIERYGPYFKAYCSVRPGLTGIWQISGRNDVSYDTRVELDTIYASRKSVVYDLGICLRTIPAVLASRGSY